ncbi:MAG: hypothetical protein V4441_01505 [Pseudomonadota bacterium]
MSPASDLSGPVPREVPQWPLSRIALWVGVGLASLGAAIALRYLVIEPHDIGFACADTVTPWWCTPRQGVVMMHLWKAWGWLGLGGGVLGLAFGWRWAVWLGYVMSLMGLVLYNADLAAIGLVLTCLRLPRA